MPCADVEPAGAVKPVHWHGIQQFVSLETADLEAEQTGVRGKDQRLTAVDGEGRTPPAKGPIRDVIIGSSAGNKKSGVIEASR